MFVASRVRGTDAPELKAFDDAWAQSKLTSLADADRPDLAIALNLALAGHVDRARALLASYQATVRDTARCRESTRSAIVAYESYLRLPMSRRFVEAYDPSSLPGIRERLGQLYEAKSNTAKAIEHDTAFIELWKHADPELQPRVAALRRGVARPTASEKR